MFFSPFVTSTDFSRWGVKPSGPHNKQARTYGGGFCCPLIIASCNYCRTLSIMDLVYCGEKRNGKFLLGSIDCVCKLIPFVWINIDSARLLPFACGVKRGGGRPPFPSPAAAKKISFTTERAASYYHHYQHQHNSGRKRITHLSLLFQRLQLQ